MTVSSNSGFLRAWSAYKHRYKESELSILKRMDARILPIFMTTIEIPPVAPLTTKTLLLGLVDFVTALDDRLAQLGHPEFRDHPRLVGAKNYFKRDDVDVPDVTAPLESLDNKSPLEVFAAVRGDLWQTITP